MQCHKNSSMLATICQTKSHFLERVIFFLTSLRHLLAGLFVTITLIIYIIPRRGAIERDAGKKRDGEIPTLPECVHQLNVNAQFSV